MTDEKPDKKKPAPRRPGGKTKRIAIRMALVLLALLMLLLLLPVCGCAQAITGKVVGVSDGDRANHRQPQQQDLPHVQLSRLQQGFRAEPRTFQE